VRMRVVGLVLPVVIGIGVAVTACSGAPGTAQPTVSATRSAANVAALGGSAASPAASGSASAVPAGYKRVGGAAEGISVAVPGSWVPVNLTEETAASAASRLGLFGKVTASEIAQAVEIWQQWHGIFVLDVKYGVANPEKFIPNLNAYCHASGTADVGADAVLLVKAAVVSVYENKLGATHLTQKDLTIGGVPGFETSYQLRTTKMGTVHQSQLVVLPKPGVGCFVTVTVGEGIPAGNVLSTAAATAQFP
jgi:hypothetical protein